MGGCASQTKEDLDIAYTNSDDTMDSMNFQKLVRYSDEFFFRFPLETNRCKNLGTTNFRRNEIVRHATNTRIVVHAKVLLLITQFLEHKCQYGTDVEKNVFEGMTHKSYLDRLIRKRPLVFYTVHDVSVLRDGTQPSSPHDWRLVGKALEGSIKQTDYLSYDEMCLSTLVGVSSPTYFINSGDRYNKGVPAVPGTFEEFGIYVGLTGARFEHIDLVESQHVLISVEWNTEENGYGARGEDTTYRRLLSIWAKLYNQGDGQGHHYFPSYTEAQEREASQQEGDPSLHKITKSDKSKYPLYLNIPVYKQRLRFPVETLLLEANARGDQEYRLVYVHVVGLGLGSWQVCDEQASWMVDVCAEVIAENVLPQVSVLNFSWFPAGLRCGGVSHQEVLETRNGNKVKILFNKRNVADPLPEEDVGKLLVACYPWDGNAFPGNEYWRGLLIVSGDPAAASCSTISELQNPYINKALNSGNVFVARRELGKVEEESKEGVESQ